MHKPTQWATIAIILLLARPVGTFAQACSGTDCRCSNTPVRITNHRQGGWFVVESDSFQVCCQESATRAEHMARHAESVRSALKSKWLGDSPQAAWNPRCQIVLHRTQQSYVNAVGRGGERTLGSSLVSISEGRTLSRRIDLLASGSDYLSAALPHELTHVVVQERFTSTAVPRWADEGAAILADSKDKQRQHHMDLVDSLAHGTAFRAGELFARDQYPGPQRIGAFYGQSASLTKFLIARGSHERFIEFVEKATSQGYDAALRTVYGIEGIPDLDRQWRRHVNLIRTVAIPTS